MYRTRPSSNLPHVLLSFDNTPLPICKKEKASDSKGVGRGNFDQCTLYQFVFSFVSGFLYRLSTLFAFQLSHLCSRFLMPD